LPNGPTGEMSLTLLRAPLAAEAQRTCQTQRLT